MSKTMDSIGAALIEAAKSCGGDTAKPKRGAPRKDGEEFMKDLGQLYRTLLMIEGFQKHRTSGFSRTLAINKAAKEITNLYPEMKGLSTSQFKKVLSKYHPSNGECWLVARILDKEVAGFDDWPAASPGDDDWDGAWKDWSKRTLGSVLEYQTKEVLEFGFGPPPKYSKSAKKWTSLNLKKSKVKR